MSIAALQLQSASVLDSKFADFVLTDSAKQLIETRGSVLAHILRMFVISTFDPDRIEYRIEQFGSKRIRFTLYIANPMPKDYLPIDRKTWQNMRECVHSYARMIGNYLAQSTHKKVGYWFSHDDTSFFIDVAAKNN